MSENTANKDKEKDRIIVIILALINMFLSIRLCFTTSISIVFEAIVLGIFIGIFFISTYYFSKIKNDKKIGINIIIVMLFIGVLFLQNYGYRQECLENRVNGKMGYIISTQKIYIYSKIGEIKETKLREFLQEVFKTNDIYIRRLSIKLGFDDGYTYTNIYFNDINGTVSKEGENKNIIKYTTRNPEVIKQRKDMIEIRGGKIKEAIEEIRLNDASNNRKIYRYFYLAASYIYALIICIQIIIISKHSKE